MSPERLLEYFERISEAPDAILRLRRFILDLAVRGKLVEQNPEDEPARCLLDSIRKADSAESNSPYPFEIPPTWVWTTFGDLADFSAGRTPSRNDTRFWNTGDYPWVSIADMEDGGLITATKETVSDIARGIVFKTDPPAAGTLLMSFKLTIGKVSRLGVPAYHNEAIISVHPRIDDMDAYFFTFLGLFAQSGRTKGAIKGATLNRKSLSAVPIPLPPLAEQHRIVAKVDELMALCDELEAAQAKREDRRDRLVAATLHGLNNGDTEPGTGTALDFTQSARFYLNHFPRLTTRPEHVHQLRKTILNLAVRGKLVEQDPDDEPAEQLLARVASKKQTGTRRGRRTPNNTVMKTSLAGSHVTPDTWAWTNALDPVVLVSDKGKKVKTKDVLESGEFPVVDQGKVLIRGYCNDPSKVISLDSPVVVFGDHTRETKFVDFDFVVGADGVKILQPIMVDARYYFLAIQWLPIESRGYGRHFKILRESLLPLPPLAEQHRIVAKVDELMALCDELEAHLTTAATTRARLVDATLHEALNGAGDTSEAAMAD